LSSEEVSNVAAISLLAIIILAFWTTLVLSNDILTIALVQVAILMGFYIYLLRKDLDRARRDLQSCKVRLKEAGSDDPETVDHPCSTPARPPADAVGAAPPEAVGATPAEGPATITSSPVRIETAPAVATVIPEDAACRDTVDDCRDNFEIGKAFEDYALRLFPRENFNIIHKTVGGADLDGRFTEDCVYPDYKFRDRTTGRTFWVECKYRSRRNERGSISWTDPDHLQKYKKIRRETRTPVYVLVGVGGSPDHPDELLFFDLDKRGYATLFHSIQGEIAIEDRPYGSLADLLRNQTRSHPQMDSSRSMISE